MAEFIKMPQKGLTEESAILTQWHVKKGDTVAPGQPLFSIETGKAVFEVESDVSGTVLECIGEVDDEIPVKAVVCVIGNVGEPYALQNTSPVAEEVLKEETTEVVASVSLSDRHSSHERTALKISPRARTLAKKRHLEVEGVRGTGPSGRIIERDIRELLDSGRKSVCPTAACSTENTVLPESTEDYIAVPNSSIRKAIARNMKVSLAELAQLTIQTDFDATAMLEYRKLLKERGNETVCGVSLNDMIAYGVSRRILSYPDLNAHYNDAEIRQFRQVHLGIAVDTPNGLMVPTVPCANNASLLSISSQIKEVAQACREGTILSDKLQGASFTITNLGAYGVKVMTPIINPPQTAILGVGAIEYKVRMDENGTPQFYPAIALSLTIDHRAVDGAPAARFLKDLASSLAVFPTLLAH